MKRVRRSIRSLMAKVAAVLCCAALLGVLSCAAPATSAKKVVSKKYPALKWGFLTSGFSKYLPPNVANIKKLIDFATEQGFVFIELRDTANLSLSDCTEIANYAKQKKIEVIYALGAGILDANYLEAVTSGIANAKVFGSPSYIRTAAGGTEFASDAKKLAWTADEFSKLVQTVNKAGDAAKAAGLRLVIENGRETLKGDGTTTFGTTELFDKVNANVGLQVDTGNFFCTSRVPANPGDVKTFLGKNVTKMGYAHVKTSKENKAQPLMGENQLPFDYFFDLCAKNKKVYMALELDTGAAASAEEIFSNYIKSIEYLQKNF